MIVITRSEYKGHPILNITPDGSRPFNLGVAKLKAVIESKETVEKFLAGDVDSIPVYIQLTEEQKKEAKKAKLQKQLDDMS